MFEIILALTNGQKRFRSAISQRQSRKRAECQTRLTPMPTYHRGTPDMPDMWNNKSPEQLTTSLPGRFQCRALTVTLYGFTLSSATVQSDSPETSFPQPRLCSDDTPLFLALSPTNPTF